MTLVWLLLILLPQSSFDLPVVVEYREKGYLLALVPIDFTVRAAAYPDGRVELRYPWYSFMTLDNEAQIETELKIVVSSTLTDHARGSVKAVGVALKPTFSEGERIFVAEAMREVLEKNRLSLSESSVQ